MEHHGVLNDLIGAGAYQMNHVWLFTFNSLTAKRKFLEAKELEVKEKRCLLIDPDECECRDVYATVMRPAPEEDNSEFLIDEEEASKIEDGTGHPTTTRTQTPSGADKRGTSQDEDITASILEADKTAACVGNGADTDKAAPGSSKSQRQKSIDGNNRSVDDASEVDPEMDDSSDPFKRPLDRVEEEDPDLEGPDWSKPQRRKKRKPRAPPEDRREQTSQSGTEEQYTEKEHMLQDVADLAREFGHKVKPVLRKATATEEGATTTSTATLEPPERATATTARPAKNRAVRDAATTARVVAAAAE
ncbi:hypothetical protein HPB47_023096 [Ixodes persulcatus]|uniref:Uncharacterized protein n=1 Tax=Ixodes persulcatus TaxID=34615 RepID=A0AC60Q7W1_IXOPE|nr:hypothetical protein HPB47_023096 [Ixodes persulcatus]